MNPTTLSPTCGRCACLVVPAASWCNGCGVPPAEIRELRASRVRFFNACRGGGCGLLRLRVGCWAACIHHAIARLVRVVQARRVPFVRSIPSRSGQAVPSFIQPFGPPLKKFPKLLLLTLEQYHREEVARVQPLLLSTFNNKIDRQEHRREQRAEEVRTHACTAVQGGQQQRHQQCRRGGDWFLRAGKWPSPLEVKRKTSSSEGRRGLWQRQKTKVAGAQQAAVQQQGRRLRKLSPRKKR